MGRQLKVYSWTGFRYGLGENSNQSYECMAAYSKAEVRRRTNMDSYTFVHSLSETWNGEVVAMATAEPGVRFYAGLNASLRGHPVWHREETTDPKA